MAFVVSSFDTASVFGRQFGTRSKVRNLYLQQRFIAHKSEVLIPLTSSSKSLYLTRNKSAQIVVKTSEKPQIVTETHENAETNVVNPKPSEEERPKSGDSEDAVETPNEVNILEKEAYSNESQNISNGYVKLSSDENKLNTVAEQNAAVVSNSSPLNLKKQFKIWDEWKKWYEQSDKEIRTWGVGKGPIFFVYDNGEGEVKVFINEEEIHNRFGSFPFMEDEGRALLDEKLAQAYQIAKDIERGVFKPPRNSSVYEFAGPNKNILEKRGLVESYVSSGVSSVTVPIPAPSGLKNSTVGFYVFSSSILLWVAWKYLFRTGPEEQTGGDGMEVEDEDKRDDNFALDLESNRGVEKIAQIQHLARQVQSFLALILQNMRVWIKQGQYGMKQLAMGINSHDFKKRIAKIQDVARQALSSFAMSLHNERVTSKKELPIKPTSTDGPEFKKTIVGIQDTANQSHLMEQNGSQVFSQQDNRDYSNSKTTEGNADGGRIDGDQPSNYRTT